MKVHLVDGTYELFRCYFGGPSSLNDQKREVGATRTLLRSLSSWLKSGEVTHVAYAFDHVIESFRNKLFAGYKTGDGIDPSLYSQFGLAERAVSALGITVWPMIEFEADDAIATGAARFGAIKGVSQVLMCSPDKDLMQCVSGKKIVSFDRFKSVAIDAAGVEEKFGVPPTSMPDLLALVGDIADGIPGIPRWGLKSAAAVLATYKDLDKIPDDPKAWKTRVRGAETLAANLRAQRRDAVLYRKLTTLRFDVPLKEKVEDLEWRGAHRKALQTLCEEIGERSVVERINKWNE